MIKWLLVIGVVAFVYYAFIKKSSPLAGSKGDGSQKSNDDADEMVECARCGIFVELAEAIVSNGKYYCSQECLKG